MAMPAWVSEIGIAAQVVIAFSAIWGEKLRARLSKPRLELMLADNSGDLELRQLPDLGIVAVRYYRLQVRNRTYFSIANEVQLFIIKIVLREPSGRTDTTFSGAVPLEWQHQELYQPARDIGHSTVAIANLFFMHANFTELTSLPQPPPTNLGGSRRGAQNFWITVVARGLNAESKPLHVEVQWDGDPAGHLSVRAVSQVP